MKITSDSLFLFKLLFIPELIELLNKTSFFQSNIASQLKWA